MNQYSEQTLRGQTSSAMHDQRNSFHQALPVHSETLSATYSIESNR
jgi:hypothetical protein